MSMTFDEMKEEFYGCDREDVIRYIVDTGGVTHIMSNYDTLEKYGYERKFHDNFNDDDWDYVIVGTNEDGVRLVAESLYVCDYTMENFGSEWIAVTYHA